MIGITLTHSGGVVTNSYVENCLGYFFNYIIDNFNYAGKNIRTYCFEY